MTSPNDIGNFTLRLGYLTACFHSGLMRDYLRSRGVTEVQIVAAYDALIAVADAAFYQKKAP